MNILVTGANGFIGKNLILELRHLEHTVYSFTRESSEEDLNLYCAKADFVFHLAGINRPKDDKEFMEGNFGLTQLLIKNLRNNNNLCPILYTSSIQANLDNPYGVSKRAGEEALEEYADQGGITYVYRLPNVFGKWSRPNYNSVIATFCYSIARDQAIKVDDRSKELTLIYIDDVICEFVNLLQEPTVRENNIEDLSTHNVTLGEIVDLLNSFKKSREDKTVPNLNDSFQKKLYSTYLSFLPKDSFKYELKMNRDDRGSFTEFLKLSERGQVSINVSKAGIVKGNHWHHTKNEKFLVVSGKGVIRFREPGTEEIIEYFVSDKKLEVIDIPPGYTHNIENLGISDMVTIMWANEYLNKDKPDTYFLEV